jgi:hypothetical protein
MIRPSNEFGGSVTDLERLVAIDAIRDLMARYARFADNKQWEDLADTFLPGGTFTPYDVEGNPLAEMRGRADIAHTIDATVGSATAIHHLFSYEIEITSPTTATGEFAMEDVAIRSGDQPLVPDEAGVKPFRTARDSGRCHARYERVDGKWFIAEMTQSSSMLDFTY